MALQARGGTRANGATLTPDDPGPAPAERQLVASADLVALARRAQAGLRRRGLSLSTAESCTGGLVGHVLTEIPGISEQYVGGIISYSNQLKHEQLGVAPATLDRHGAVSAEVCLAMAANARVRLRSDVALAITGIAGPEGGSSEKPVGLTYVAVADDAGHIARQHLWHGDRSWNKLASARAALELLLERLDDV